MEEITKLMQLIDSNSDSIKEGNYLEMCNTLKTLYTKIPKREDPPVVDLRSLPQRPVSVPFSPILPTSNLASDLARSNAILYELARNSRTMVEIHDRIKMYETLMADSKYLKNITKNIKTESVIYKAMELGITLENNTIHDLRAAGVEIPNERTFYKDYITMRNVEISSDRDEIMLGLSFNQEELDALTQRQSWLIENHNL